MNCQWAALSRRFCLSWFVVAFAVPAEAVVVTDDPELRLSALGAGLDGVVEIVHPQGGYCSGALLWTGRHILTAAHCEMPAGAAVWFTGPDETLAVTAVRAVEHPEHDGQDADLAILTLETEAPPFADRYELYTEPDELNQVFLRTGYGRTGAGAAGASGYPPAGRKVEGLNRYEATGDVLNPLFELSGFPLYQEGLTLVYDFDSGRPENDALAIAGLPDLGLGDSEAMVAPGDSGGPTFIDGRIAGVAVAYYTGTYQGLRADIDDVLNSSFGEVGVDLRVSAYQGWIRENVTAIPEPTSAWLWIVSICGALTGRRRCAADANRGVPVACGA